MQTLLFLCTGNYYRSRFAEIFFNRLADSANLDWIADSRGVSVDKGNKNVGPISKHAVDGLKTCGIRIEGEIRFPLQARAEDFQHASLVIALKEAEHRRVIAQRFPEWEDKVEYWHIHDVDQASAEIALGEIQILVKALIERLKRAR